MPRTPYALRPIGRTSVSSKRIAMPSQVPMKTCSLPSESSTAITESPSSMPIAMMPLGRGLLNADRSVFLTVPFRVPITMNCWSSCSGNSFTARSAAIFSSGCSCTRFTIAFPLPPGPTSGTSWTLSQ